MYFPIGWPKVLAIKTLNKCSISQLICNRDKIFFAVLSEDTLFIYYCKPCLLIVYHRRNKASLEDCGINILAQWRPDSSEIVVVTSCGFLLYYKVSNDTVKSVYEQVDPPQANLRRDSAELFVKVTIPSLKLILEQEISVMGCVTSICCIRDELMVTTNLGEVLRYRWDGTLNLDYSVKLDRVPFCIDQQSTKAIPILEKHTYIIDIDYSPLIGGFAVVFNDGRAAFLTAYTLKFDPNQMQGIWAPNIDDATCACVNHKFRLITFGRKNSDCVVYSVEEITFGLILSHKLSVPSQVYTGQVGAVHCLRWSPDACVLAVAWEQGGISLWSTFGSLLMCSLSWDYGLNNDLSLNNPLNIQGMEWSTEGYQLWVIKRTGEGDETEDSVIQFAFVKSALTVNPCVSHHCHLCLQSQDRVYINLGVGLKEVCNRGRNSTGIESPLSFKFVDSKQWIVIDLPTAYAANNWPIRYACTNPIGDRIVVAGKCGLAHYSISGHKWRIFGNESEERDMVVSGGLGWCSDNVVAGCYDVNAQIDQLRVYPAGNRLANDHMIKVNLSAQLLLLDVLIDTILAFCADGRISIFSIHLAESGNVTTLELIQTIDTTSLCVHPACFVSITLTSVRIEPSRKASNNRSNFVVNVSGRLLMVSQQEDGQGEVIQPPTVLASCVENVWSPVIFRKSKPHLTESLWLYCGAHGIRVWLPLFPRQGDNNSHTFMSKRIMLHFNLNIYPLAILFEDAILIGAENDTTIYTSDANSPFSLPFCVIERTSQVYLHHILRQLLRRNLGFHAWEIAQCCTSLPYFPHSLELLLHEVLEEEATSKEPLPDAQLPSVIEFIKEFPVYLDTVVQCARKTEIALWPYLFSVAGKPTVLFQKCLEKKLLETAASYLIILQNLESSAVSKQYATLLLDSTLNHNKWELSKELVRFLKAIDPNDVECMRAPLLVSSNCRIPQTPPVNGNEDDFNLVLGTTQISRGRSFSTTTTPKNMSNIVSGSGVDKSKGPHSRASVTDINNIIRKKSLPSVKEYKDKSKTAEEYFMDALIERHARMLLSKHKLHDLGSMAAQLDFPLVRLLAKERHRAAVVDNCILALQDLHKDFSWPFPPINTNSSTKLSQTNENERLSVTELGEPSSQIGDSGYMSYRGQLARLSLSDNQFIQQHQIDNRSQLSDPDSMIYNEDNDYTNDCLYSWSEIPPQQILDQLAAELPNQGTSKSDIHLRYLLQLLTDAGCLQWAFLVAVLLKDVMAVYRLINAARSPDQTHDSVNRLKEDIITLLQWSLIHCPGYRPFMFAIQSQIGALNRVLTVKNRSVSYSSQNDNSHIVSSVNDNNNTSGQSSSINDQQIQSTSSRALTPVRTVSQEIIGKSNCNIS